MRRTRVADRLPTGEFGNAWNVSHNQWLALCEKFGECQKVR
jgi:hypothetical protein